MAISHLHINNELGIFGEDAATNLLKQKKYHILERNWKINSKEIDIIAENDKDIVFVEVKTRTGQFLCRPEENVDAEKRQNLVVAANAYIKINHIEKNPRFDIIGILVNKETQEIKELTHLEDAFGPATKTIHAKSFSGQWKWKSKSHRR